MMMFHGDAAGMPDPISRGLARDLEAAVRSAAAEAVLRAMGDVKTAIATMDTHEAAARDALADAAMALPEKLQPVIEAVVRTALRDEREALAAAAERGFEAAAAKLDAAVVVARDQVRGATPGAEAPAGDVGQDLLDRVIEDWRSGLAEALAGALVPHAGALADVAARVESVDERLGDMETLLRMQGDAIAALGRKLDGVARPGPGAATQLDEEALARAIEARLRPAIANELQAAIDPLAAEQRTVGERAETRAGVSDLALKAVRTHIKAATRAEKEHAERLGAVYRTVEGIGGRLAFTVEALSGHAALIERLRGAARWQSMLAIANFVAALLVFIAVFLDRFWYLLQ